MNNTGRDEYIANGVTTVFAFSFYIMIQADITITINDETVDSGFVVTGILNPAGGSVVFNSPPENGAKVTLILTPLPERLVTYQQNGDLNPTTLNSDFDRIYLIVSSSKYTVDRALSLGLSDIDGQGAYRAKGNRITGLGTPTTDTDAARLGDIRPYADRAEAAAASAANAEQKADEASAKAEEAAQRAEDAAASSDAEAVMQNHIDQLNPHTQYILKSGFDYWDLAPVGKIELWAGTLPPNDKWLRFTGISFDPLEYPELSALGIFPNNTIPDLTNRYPRIIGTSTTAQWTLLEDAMQRITGQVGGVIGYLGGSISSTGAFSASGSSNAFGAGATAGITTASFDSAKQTRTATETRPKTFYINHLIVKAKP